MPKRAKSQKPAIFIPTAVFFGRLHDREGKPVNGPAALYPMCDTRCFYTGPFLFGMCNYHFDITDGYFCVDVLPTDFGVDQPYSYAFDTPIAVYEVTLPGMGPHDFAHLLRDHR